MGIFHNLYSRALEQDSRLWSRRTERTFVTIISAGALVGVYYYSKQETIPYSKRSHLILMSHEKEKRRGDHLKSRPSQIFTGDVLPRNHVESIRVNSVASTMIDALNRDIKEENVWPRRNCDRERKFIQGMKWEVVVVDSPIRNAYCLPAGKIFVSTGMLTNLRTDTEVARLIGHEMGHAVGRHYAERILLESTLHKFWFLVYLLAPWMLLIRKCPGSENCVTRRFIEHPRNRKREIEADYIGLLLMASAGYDPRIAPEEQKRLAYPEDHLEEYSSYYPTPEKRAMLLAQDHVMEEALLFYNKAKARGRKSEVKLNTSKESISQKESINSNN